MEVLLFGGTTEGRVLSEWLGARSHRVTVCVATEYGAALLPEGLNIYPLVGRMDEAEMARQMAKRPYACVVDATHPYAARVTIHIQSACARTGLQRYRLVREGEPEGDWLRSDSIAQSARKLEELPGNVLLSTGSKELAPFAVPGLVERCHPRVLPTQDSLGGCLELGFPPAHVICMQGPFSVELNVALIRQYKIQILVTKASGGAGGFWEKVDAARKTGCQIIVISRPTVEEGVSLTELKSELEREGL